MSNADGERPLVYLDTSALIDFADEGLQLREKVKAQLVYSCENLEEIDGKHSEGSVLDFLERERGLLIPWIDAEAMERASISVSYVEPRRLLSEIRNLELRISDSQFGIASFLQKMMGGRRDQTFTTLADEAQADFQILVNRLADETRSLGFNPEVVTRRMLEAFRGASQEAGRLADGVASEYDVSSEGMFGVDANIINNLPPKDAIVQIGQRIPGELREHADLIPFSWFKSEAQKRAYTDDEVLQGVMFLNHVGYWREKNIRKDAEQSRSMANAILDAKHICHARYCHIFISADKSQTMQAKAIYSHIGSSCLVARLEAG